MLERFISVSGNPPKLGKMTLLSKDSYSTASGTLLDFSRVGFLSFLKYICFPKDFAHGNFSCQELQRPEGFGTKRPVPGQFDSRP